jgi:hypothetical protein
MKKTQPFDRYKPLSKFSEKEIDADPILSTLREQMEKENELVSQLNWEIQQREEEIKNITVIRNALLFGNELTPEQSSFIQSNLSQGTSMYYREEFLGIIDYPEHHMRDEDKKATPFEKESIKLGFEEEHLIEQRRSYADGLCNTPRLVDDYPAVYQMAWNVMYKGKITKAQEKELIKMQCFDIKESNYVPENIFSVLRWIISGKAIATHYYTTGHEPKGIVSTGTWIIDMPIFTGYAERKVAVKTLKPHNPHILNQEK